jgi:DNA-binding transcriptional LysR family regulator
MELRHIRYFFVVAEELNFTRAAARIGIGQPPLSQQIKDLEAEIGTPLFRRLAQGAELTSAGKAFLERVSAIPTIAAAGGARGSEGSVANNPGGWRGPIVSAFRQSAA